MRSNQWDVKRLRSEATYWRSRILITAAHLDLFSWIGKGEKSARAVTAHLGGNPQCWEIFLNALCGMGLIRKRGAKYANTLFSLRHLSSGRAGFFLPDHDAWDIWGKLPRLLTAGKRPRTSQPFFTDRRKAERLLLALHLDAQQIAPYLIRRLSLSRCRTFLDIGAGCGTFALRFCRYIPRLEATIIEHPDTAYLARRFVGEAGMAGRARVIGIDFLRHPLPRGFDAVLLSNVLHGQGEDENLSLLVKIYRSLNPTGRLIVRDVFMRRDRTDPEWGALFSVLLLLHTPKGRCYGLDEIRGWLRRAGFSRIKGPFRSSPLSFDPDSVLIAEKK